MKISSHINQTTCYLVTLHVNSLTFEVASCIIVHVFDKGQGRQIRVAVKLGLLNGHTQFQPLLLVSWVQDNAGYVLHYFLMVWEAKKACAPVFLL